MYYFSSQISNDIYHGDEDTSYAWVREYHWDVGFKKILIIFSKLNLLLLTLIIEQVKGDDAEDPTTYLVHFDENTARYLVLCEINFLEMDRRL